MIRSFHPQPIPSRNPAPVLALAGLLALTACAQHGPAGQVSDPYEAANRRAHKFNLAVDTALFGNGQKKGAVPKIPEPVTIAFGNFSSNLGMPSAVLNNLLQGKPGPALQDTFRFALNTTVGIGGLFDPASAIGLDAEQADFGETLYVWGVPEGNYLVVPLWGPTTERDWTGTVVDVVLNPMNTVLKWPDKGYAGVITLTGKAGNRQRFAKTYESILYDSADSYAAAKLLAMQNRNFELGAEAEVIDPNEDPYAP